VSSWFSNRDLARLQAGRIPAPFIALPRPPSLRDKYARTETDYPVERPDVLARLGVFADVHRRSRWTVGSQVQPVVDVTAHREQVPTFYGESFITAGGAGAFSACELALASIFQNQNIIAKPLMICINELGAANRAVIMIRQHQFLGGAPTQNLTSFLDGRRGLATGQAAATIQSSASVANASGDPRILLTPGPIILGPDDGLLESLWIAALQDLVIANTVANDALRVGFVWTEEEQRPTRARA
jgi:hypothetical protein